MGNIKTLQNLPTDLFEKVLKKYPNKVILQKIPENGTRKMFQIKNICVVIEHIKNTSELYVTDVEIKTDITHNELKILRVTGDIFIKRSSLRIYLKEEIGGVQGLLKKGNNQKYQVLELCTEIQNLCLKMLKQKNLYKKTLRMERKTQLPPLFSSSERKALPVLV